MRGLRPFSVLRGWFVWIVAVHTDLLIAEVLSINTLRISIVHGITGNGLGAGSCGPVSRSGKVRVRNDVLIADCARRIRSGRVMRRWFGSRSRRVQQLMTGGAHDELAGNLDRAGAPGNSHRIGKNGYWPHPARARVQASPAVTGFTADNWSQNAGSACIAGGKIAAVPVRVVAVFTPADLTDRRAPLAVQVSRRT